MKKMDKPKKMMHKMKDGMMMSDAEMASMMSFKKTAKKKAKK